MINELKEYREVLLVNSLNYPNDKELFKKWDRCSDLIYYCENLMARPGEWYEAKQLVKEFREIKNERV